MKINRELYEKDLTAALNGLPLDKLFGRVVLVTGATGMIGSCLVDLFLRHNEIYPDKTIKIIALSRSKEKLTERFAGNIGKKYFTVINHDVTKPLPENISFDYAVHAASPTDPAIMSKYPVDTMAANFIGMFNILTAAKKNKAEGALLVSSGEVYGNIDKDIKSEKDYGYIDNLNVRACYPVSKRAAENLCASFGAQYGVRTTIARLCHTFGPTMIDSDNRAASSFLRDAAAGQKIVLKSDGSTVRSYCYAIDAVRAIVYILMKGESSRAYNVAPDESISIRQFAELCAKHSGQELDFRPQSEGDFKIVRQVLDNTELHKLGWQAQFDIEDAIQRTIKMYR